MNGALEISEALEGDVVSAPPGVRAFLVRVRDYGDGRLPWKRGCTNCRNQYDTGIASFIERAMRPKEKP